MATTLQFLVHDAPSHESHVDSRTFWFINHNIQVKCASSENRTLLLHRLCATFLVDITGASSQLCSDSVYVLWKTHRWRLVTFPLQHWTIIIKLVIIFLNILIEGAHLAWKWARNCLCEHSTSCFSKEQHWFYALLYSLPLSAILCKLAHKQIQHNTSTAGKCKN
jgi:hypothetical protein